MDELELLKKENKELRNIVLEYEKEHNTVFKEWIEGIQANKNLEDNTGDLKAQIKHLEAQLDQALKDDDETLERIDKAIEYIENNKLYHYEYDEEELFEIVRSNKKELIEILKGDSNG